jgi:hypothetical protein
LTSNKPQFSMGEMILNVGGIVMKLAKDLQSFLVLAF